MLGPCETFRRTDRPTERSFATRLGQRFPALLLRDSIKTVAPGATACTRQQRSLKKSAGVIVRTSRSRTLILRGSLRASSSGRFNISGGRAIERVFMVRTFALVTRLRRAKHDRVVPAVRPREPVQPSCALCDTLVRCPLPQRPMPDSKANAPAGSRNRSFAI